MIDIIIVGAGGNAKVLIDIILENENNEIWGILDDNKELLNKILYRNIKVIDTLNFMNDNKHYNYCLSIGNNKVRKSIVEKYNIEWINVISKYAIISPTAKIGVGTHIYPNSVIESDAIIGNHTIINIASSIHHDVFIGDFCNVAPKCAICGTTIIGNNTFIGAGSTIINNCNIGNNVIIGLGSTIVSNIEDNTIYYGIKAKFIRENKYI